MDARVKSTPFTVSAAFDALWRVSKANPEKSDVTEKALLAPAVPTSCRRYPPEPLPVLIISAVTPKLAPLIAVAIESNVAPSTAKFVVVPLIVMPMAVDSVPLIA